MQRANVAAGSNAAVLAQEGVYMTSSILEQEVLLWLVMTSHVDMLHSRCQA